MENGYAVCYECQVAMADGLHMLPLWDLDAIPSNCGFSALKLSFAKWAKCCVRPCGAKKVHSPLFTASDTSTWRTQVNGLPQGSVLSPTLFNLYTNDLLVTGSRKFIYADNICLTKQAQRYAELECCLSSDMMRMASYCRQRRLKPSPMKTVTSVFHLLNTSAARELRVHMEGQQLWHNPNLGVTLDRTLELLATPYKDCQKVTKPE